MFQTEAMCEEYRAKAFKEITLQARLILHIVLLRILVISAIYELHHIRIGVQVVSQVEDVQNTEHELAVCVEVFPSHHEHVAMIESQLIVVAMIFGEVLIDDLLTFQEVVDVVRSRILLVHVVIARNWQDSRAWRYIKEVLAILIDANPIVSLVLPYVPNVIAFSVCVLHGCDFVLGDILYREPILIGKRSA